MDWKQVSINGRLVKNMFLDGRQIYSSGPRMLIIPPQNVLRIDAYEDSGENNTIQNLAQGTTISLPTGWSKEGNSFTTCEEYGLDFGTSTKNIFKDTDSIYTTGFTTEYVFNQIQEKQLKPDGYGYPIAQNVCTYWRNDIAGEFYIESKVPGININRWSGAGVGMTNYKVPLNENVSIAVTVTPYINGYHTIKFYVNGVLKQTSSSATAIQYGKCNRCPLWVNRLYWYTTKNSFVGKLFAVRHSFAVLSDYAIWNNFQIDSERYGITT